MGRRARVRACAAPAGWAGAAAFACALLACAAPAAAQRTAPRLVEWPVRTSATPGALLEGAAAAFWNPAGAQALSGRAEASLLDLVAPDGIDVDVLAVAGALRLGERAAVTLGYAHFGVDPIPVTTTSPIPEPGSIRVSEQELSLAGAYAVGGALALGAGARYARAELGDDAHARLGGVAGARWSPALPGAPLVAASLLRQGGATRWQAGLAASLPVREAWTLRGGYGVSGGGGSAGGAHTVSVEGAWRTRARVVATLAGESDGGERAWLPLLGADLRLGRYVLGVVREELPNDFGAAYSYRLDITF